MRWTLQEAQPAERQVQTGVGQEEGAEEGENPREPWAWGAGRRGGERGEAGHLDGARWEEGDREEEGARPRYVVECDSACEFESDKI